MDQNIQEGAACGYACLRIMTVDVPIVEIRQQHRQGDWPGLARSEDPRYYEAVVGCAIMKPASDASTECHRLRQSLRLGEVALHPLILN
jgi:hypothetical protein